MKHKKQTPLLNMNMEISRGTKFQLKITILIFRTKFPQKGYFQSKPEKVNTPIELYIFKFHLKLTNLLFFLDQKWYVQSKLEKVNNIFKFWIFELV